MKHFKVDDYLTKPVDPGTLRDAVARNLKL